MPFEDLTPIERAKYAAKRTMQYAAHHLRPPVNELLESHDLDTPEGLSLYRDEIYEQGTTLLKLMNQSQRDSEQQFVQQIIPGIFHRPDLIVIGVKNIIEARVALLQAQIAIWLMRHIR